MSETENESRNESHAATGQDRDNNEIYPAKPPAKRESHRPSLEVVEVEIKSSYEKGDFKRDLQVGRKRVDYAALTCRKSYVITSTV